MDNFIVYAFSNTNRTLMEEVTNLTKEFELVTDAEKYAKDIIKNEPMVDVVEIISKRFNKVVNAFYK